MPSPTFPHSFAARALSSLEKLALWYFCNSNNDGSQVVLRDWTHGIVSGRGIVKSFKILIVTLIAVGAIWTIATPAQAQLAPGCTCPAGSSLGAGGLCFYAGATILGVPPICTKGTPTRTAAINQSVGHVAASQQQLSFSGVNTVLQQRRDQLQSTLGGQGTSSSISGYAPSEFDTDTDSNALGYASQSQKTNPLVYKAAPPPAPANPVWAVWGQGLGSWEHDGALAATDIAYFNSTYTAQGGVDRTWQHLMSSDDALVLGIVSSWTASHVSYDNTPTTMQLVGPGVGLYGTYIKGGFSADLTPKLDFLQMLQDFAGVAPNASVGITNAGVSGNVQYKVTWADNNFVEPTAGYSFTRAIFGSGAAALDLEDASTLRLQAGARLGTTWHVNGISVDASLKALVYEDVIAQGTSIAASAFGAAITPTDQGLVRGEFDPQLCFNLADGYSVTLAGNVHFGEAVLGGSASLNLRKQW